MLIFSILYIIVVNSSYNRFIFFIIYPSFEQKEMTLNFNVWFHGLKNTFMKTKNILFSAPSFIFGLILSAVIILLISYCTGFL